MLILQRKTGESIRIGNDIRITVTDTSGDKVKLAIEAPKYIPIAREELVEAAKNNKEAAAFSADALNRPPFLSAELPPLLFKDICTQLILNSWRVSCK